MKGLECSPVPFLGFGETFQQPLPIFRFIPASLDTQAFRQIDRSGMDVVENTPTQFFIVLRVLVGDTRALAQSVVGDPVPIDRVPVVRLDVVYRAVWQILGETADEVDERPSSSFFQYGYSMRRPNMSRSEIERSS